MSILPPNPPAVNDTGPSSLLARHLGSEAAAVEARRQADRRAREDRLRYRRLGAAGVSSPDEAELRSLRQDVRCLRDQRVELTDALHRLRSELSEMVRRETRTILADELPEALDYRLNGRAP